MIPRFSRPAAAADRVLEHAYEVDREIGLCGPASQMNGSQFRNVVSQM